MRRSAGFTLIEIAVVLLILSMLLGTTISNMRGMVPAAATEASAREILGVLDFARTQAVASGQSYEVVFDLDEQRYAIRTPYDLDGNPTEDVTLRTVLQWRRMAAGTLLEGVLDAGGQRRERGTWSIAFHPAGDSQDFWAYVSHEAAPDANRVTVRVLGLTGLATLIQGEALPPALQENDF